MSASPRLTLLYQSASLHPASNTNEKVSPEPIPHICNPFAPFD